jgi:hypothetical protein
MLTYSLKVSVQTAAPSEVKITTISSLKININARPLRFLRKLVLKLKPFSVTPTDRLNEPTN